ncbi:MAG TPA: hypothetical protein VFD92_27185 [Candidatus Binatia bacterium]|nr:hypothetical protein [Candidatus Binatia bacterium]
MRSKGTCKADACDKDAVGKGYCERHYRAWKRGGLPKARYKTCKTEGCRKRQVRAAHCEEHQKLKPAAAGGAAGTTEAPAPAPAPAEPPAAQA